MSSGRFWSAAIFGDKKSSNAVFSNYWSEKGVLWVWFVWFSIWILYQITRLSTESYTYALLYFIFVRPFSTHGNHHTKNPSQRSTNPSRWHSWPNPTNEKKKDNFLALKLAFVELRPWSLSYAAPSCYSWLSLPLPVPRHPLMLLSIQISTLTSKRRGPTPTHQQPRPLSCDIVKMV
jgi:hypothetical protein